MLPQKENSSPRNENFASREWPNKSERPCPSRNIVVRVHGGCRAGKLKFTWADLNWIFLLPFWSWMWMFWLEVFQFQTITHPSHPIPSSRRAELQPSSSLSSLLFLPRHVALGVSGVRGCNKVGKYGHLCSVLWVLWKIPMHSGNSSLDVNEAFSGSEVFAFPCGISPLHSSG